MAFKFFRPKPGRFGVQPILSSTINRGTTTLTANTTTDFYLTAAIHRPRYVDRISACASTVAVDADGTITAIVYKVASGTTLTALTSAFDLEGLTANVSSKLTITGSDADRTLAEGDILLARVTNNSAAIDTQPVDLNLNAESLLLE